MPVAQLYLVTSAYPEEAIAGLLRDVSQFYAGALYPEMAHPPIERVRVFVTAVAPAHWATGGVPVDAGGKPAPFFSCIAMKGRPPERINAMMAGFTDRIVAHLHCERDMVRGRLIEIEPAHWFISGTPASEARQAEIAARAGGTT